MRNLTAADLERESNNLSSFDGDDSGYDGNIGSFMEPINRGKIYTIVLNNANTTNARTALLCPGLLRNAVGLMQTGAFNDITGASGLSAFGNPRAIEYLNAYIDKFPTLVSGFKVSSTNILQFEQILTIQKESPFKIDETRNIYVSAWASEANPNTTLISVQEAFYMDAQTQVEYAVLPSTSVSIMLFFGVSLNIARVLRDQVQAMNAKQAILGGGLQLDASNYSGRR
ncbi:MAG: hypothetical protein ACXVJE_19335 [Mucilaginibacter sp.]